VFFLSFLPVFSFPCLFLFPSFLYILPTSSLLSVYVSLHLFSLFVPSSPFPPTYLSFPSFLVIFFLHSLFRISLLSFSFLSFSQPLISCSYFELNLLKHLHWHWRGAQLSQCIVYNSSLVTPPADWITIYTPTQRSK
jgi:hypothetical protein